MATDSTLEKYLAYLESVRGLSKSSLSAYGRDVRLMLEFIERGGYDEESPDFVRPFLGELSRRGLSTRSVNRMLSSLRGYFRFKTRMGLGRYNPLEGVKGLRSGRRLPSFLFEDQMESLLDDLDGGAWELRDRALFEFLYSTGCRVSEAVALNVTDLDLVQRRVVVRGKGKKERNVFLGSAARRALTAYLEQRKARFPARRAETALFVNTRGGRLTDRGVRHILDGHLDRLAFGRKVSPHTFRHSFATHILNSGADIRIVQELLGHASLSTTQVYTHVGLDRLKDVYRRAHPHGRVHGRREAGPTAPVRRAEEGST